MSDSLSIYQFPTSYYRDIIAMESLDEAGAQYQNLTSAQKDEIMDQVKQQLAIATAQELLAVSISLTLIF